MLDDLEAEKKTKMEHFINKTREELVSLWDMCYYSKAQRERFRPYFSIDYTESLLEDHEKEVEHLKEYYHDNLDLFNKVKKRQDLWKTMLELEEKKKDQTYLFKAKGNTLLEDEKNRKRVNKVKRNCNFYPLYMTLNSYLFNSSCPNWMKSCSRQWKSTMPGMASPSLLEASHTSVSLRSKRKTLDVKLKPKKWLGWSRRRKPTSMRRFTEASP